MGYIFAIITSVFFTAYTIPKKLSGQTTMRYSMFQGMGFFGASALVFLIQLIIRGEHAELINDPFLWLSALAGAVWFAGCAFFFLAIDEMGLSSSNQWKNLQGPFGAVFNLLFLAEYRQTNVFFVILSCAFILVSAMFLTVRGSAQSNYSARGIIYALAAAFLFGINAMLLKNGTNHGFIYSQQIVLSGTVFICSVLYLLIKEKSISCIRQIAAKDNLLGISGGVLFYAASFFSLQAYSILPGSITFTIIQLNAVWTVLCGVFIFKEIDFRKNWMRIAMGIVCAVIGVIMLLFA